MFLKKTTVIYFNSYFEFFVNGTFPYTDISYVCLQVAQIRKGTRILQYDCYKRVVMSYYELFTVNYEFLRFIYGKTPRFATSYLR